MKPHYPDRRLRIDICPGGHATVEVHRLGPRWAIATSTGAPGWGARSSVVDLEQTYPTLPLAIEAGLLRIRTYWQARHVESIVRRLDQYLEWEVTEGKR